MHKTAINAAASIVYSRSNRLERHTEDFSLAAKLSGSLYPETQDFNFFERRSSISNSVIQGSFLVKKSFSAARAL